jgi:ABC-type multidrug transport system fused ATPase/permease subunit
MLRFPPEYFNRSSVGELIPIITAEVEPVGGFVGDSFVTPVFQGGTLLTILLFMLMQDPILCLAAVSLYPLQIYLIPKLQRKVNNMTRQRVRMVRQLSDRIGESAYVHQEVHQYGIFRYLLADFSHRLDENYRLRFDIYVYKFLIKFLNNFLAQLTPFFFYAIGGYLVINGQLSFGALVAILAAYKDLASPWRELLDYYQQMEDARIKYEQVVLQFDPPGMITTDQPDAPEFPMEAKGRLAALGVSVVNDAGNKILDNLSLDIPVGQHVALIGPETGGRHELARVLAGMVRPSSGMVTLGGQDLAILPNAVTTRFISYVGHDARLVAASLHDNLVFGLLHRPAELSEPSLQREAILTGSSLDDPTGDWIDYAEAGLDSRDQLTGRIIDVLEITDLLDDVREFGLRGRLAGENREAAEKTVLTARFAIRENLHELVAAGVFEPFDPDRFNNQGSLAENLMFGAPLDSAFDADHLGENAHVRAVLDTLGVTDRLTRLGVQVVEIMAEIFRGLPPGHEFFEKYGFVTSEELSELTKRLAKIRRGGDGLPEDPGPFLSLLLRIVPARHRLSLIDDRLREDILASRRLFAATLPPELKGSIAFFEIDRYNPALSIADNLLFGRLAPGQMDPNSHIRQRIIEVLDRAGLRAAFLAVVVEAALRAPVGIGGSRLSPASRQKVAIARSLLKAPAILILADPLSVADVATQERVTAAVTQACKDSTLIWALQQSSLSGMFDRTLELNGGRIVESSMPQADAPEDTLSDVISKKRAEA